MKSILFFGLLPFLALLARPALAQQTPPPAPPSRTLGEVTVQGVRARYTPADSVGRLTLRGPQRLLDVPQQVQAVPRAVLDDQAAITLSDATRNVSGVINSGGSGWTGSVIRGFLLAADNYLVNGQRAGLTGTDLVPFLPHMEQVQVLKGPSGTLFGNGGLGGTINFVPKKPLAARQLTATAAAGSFNTYRAGVDATGALTADKKLLGRLNAWYQDAKGFTDFFYSKTLIVAPALTWNLGNKTTLDYNGSYMRDSRNGNWPNGVPAVNGNALALPRSFTSNDPSDWVQHTGIFNQLNLTHRFSEHLTATAQLSQSRTSWEGRYFIAQTGTPVDSAGNLNRFWEGTDAPNVFQKQAANAFVTWQAGAGRVKNTLTVGGDYARRRDDYPNSFDRAAAPLNVFRPVYQDQRDKSGQYPNDSANYYYGTYGTYYGAYLQDFVELSPKLKALLGLRYEKFDQKFRYDAVNQAFSGAYMSRDTSTGHALIPRVGLTYQPVRRVSAFASYAQGYEPQSGNNPKAGGPFPPEKGHQWELGLKTALLPAERLSLTASVYRIDKQNVLTPDPTDPLGFRLKTTGEVRSEGVELDVAGEVLPGLNAVLNYAYNDVQVRRSEVAAEVGQRFANTIRHTANAWVSYRLPTGPLQGLKIGAGGQYAARRLADAATGFYVPGYGLLNASLAYDTPRFGVQLNANNLTDKDYVAGTIGRGTNYLFRGTPRNVLLTLRYTVGQ